MNRLMLALVAVLVASAPTAFAQDASQIRAAESAPPIERVEKDDHGMDSMLAALYDSTVAGEPTPSYSSLSFSQDGQRVEVILVMVEIGASIPLDLGIEVGNSYENMVQASVPIRNLEAIVADENIIFIEVPSRPVPRLVVPGIEEGTDKDQALTDIPYTSSSEYDPRIYLMAAPAVIAPVLLGLLLWQWRK